MLNQDYDQSIRRTSPLPGRDGVDTQPITLRHPTKADGPAIHKLVSLCPPLDLNSLYSYLLLAEHFTTTCIMAELNGLALGFVSAYKPPARPDVLFVWQVAVHEQARGQGLGKHMLQALLKKPALNGIHYLETTVSPDNTASRHMFSRLAQHLNVAMHETPLFDKTMFGPLTHDDEPLLHIGPLCSERLPTLRA